MIAAVRGTVEAKSLDSAYLTVGGVTLRVFAPLSTLAALTVGETAHLHTYLLVREDVLALYGFATASDREAFEQLLAVGGVGPRIGVALLSTMSAAGLRDAILAEDLTRLSLAPGVGKKLAARLVLELRPRFEKMAPGEGAAMVTSGGPGSRAAVVDALTSLGYPPT
ncbi:MAG TPA: Holliday junction branch migration protein RuvA, partial [Ktedonobacterales bacterium]|nr:Holliday junction branch migration protein RuvA [Ktedonobacterales bacterium]